MTKGSPWRLIVQFTVPVFLSQVFQQLYNTADALIVGRFLGDEALAAVSASGPLIYLLISFFVGLAMGAGVTISRYFGAGDYESVSRAIHTDVMIGLISGVVLTFVGVWLTPTFLRWMGTAPEVLPDAVAYFRYYFFGILAVVLYNICKSIMNALGDSRRPLYYLVISSLTNIVLDLLFIGVFHWGVWAAAMATTISQAVSMVLCLIHLTRKGTIYQIQLKKLRVDSKMLGEIVRYGLPSGVQNSVIGFANVIVQSNINAFGKVAMAAYGAYSKLEGFAFLPVTSFTMSLTTFVGQNLGAGLYDRSSLRCSAPRRRSLRSVCVRCAQYRCFSACLRFLTQLRRSAAARARPSCRWSLCCCSGAWCALRISPSSWASCMRSSIFIWHIPSRGRSARSSISSTTISPIGCTALNKKPKRPCSKGSNGKRIAGFPFEKAARVEAKVISRSEPASAFADAGFCTQRQKKSGERRKNIPLPGLRAWRKYTRIQKAPPACLHQAGGNTDLSQNQGRY